MSNTAAALPVPFAVLPAPHKGFARTGLKPPLIARDTLAVQTILGWEGEDFRLYRAAKQEAIPRFNGRSQGWVVPADIDAVFCMAGSGEYLIDWLARHGMVEDTSRSMEDNPELHVAMQNEAIQGFFATIPRFPPSLLVAIEQNMKAVNVGSVGLSRDDLASVTNEILESVERLERALDDVAGGDPARAYQILCLYGAELQPYLLLLLCFGLTKQVGFGGLRRALGRKPAPPRKRK